MKSGNYPASRNHDIVVKEVDGEVLIYDLLKDKALCLNQTSAMIWRACDGTRSVSEIANAVSHELKAPVSDDIVWFALNQFKADNLLVESHELVTPFDGLTRREIVRRVGLASIVALPFIAALVAPTALHAQSGCLPAGAVTTGTFPFGPGNDSNTCLTTLRARCCSNQAAAGSFCNCVNNPTPNTCVGTVTCL